MGKKFCIRATRGGLKDELEELRALDFDGQSANFTNGLVVTGGTSAARGTLVSHTDAGTTGTLILRNVVGTFTDNEAITDSSTGAAVANLTDYCPLIAPSDQIILQVDAASDKDKAWVLEQLRLIKMKIQDMKFPSAS